MSPTCMAFSSSRKMPVIRSCTSFCEPKPIATPTMPAPASSGPMFTPISDSTIMPATITMVISSVVRSSGSSVRSRAERAACASRVKPGEVALDRGVDRLPDATASSTVTAQREQAGQHAAAKVGGHQPVEGAKSPELQQADRGDE